MTLGKEFFLKKFFAKCLSAWHSAKKKKFKNSLPSAPMYGTRQREKN
jgi:hypothetical protein